MRLDNRNKMLVGGFILSLAVSYQLAIKKILALRSAHLKNTELRERAKDMPRKLAALRQQEMQLDAQFKKLYLESSNFQNELLRFLNEQGSGHSVKIMDFKALHVIIEGNTTTRTYQFILEGNFTDILKVVHALETQGSFGGVTHMAFEKQKDPRQRKSYLQASLHLQQIE
ncbi:hypothetical protein D2V08_01730 [Flagellimonas lutimaris]|uniref:Uncharacterized protein n=1 Tax=Flagellimonas lutimaris TaxID=475082 RepID=A0A3A1NDB9_9FLAO|nr:hypothetical protein [Allomuricauda lutimaris]RIV36659.1 hypothetical protein D2V08_01730 [Allomuricauda lutimaris]